MRDEVRYLRWESPDGRKGCSPKSERDWKAYRAAKQEIGNGSMKAMEQALCFCYSC
jgi:hypothetical protein